MVCVVSKWNTRRPRTRGVVPLRHLRHVPPPDGVATLVNSLQNRVKSITLCVIFNSKMGNSPCDAMHSDWMAFYNAFWCETVTRKWHWLHPEHGGTCPHFYKWLGTGAPRVRRTKKQESDQTVLATRKRLPKRLIVLVKPKKWRGTTKNFSGASRLTCASHF